MSSALCIIETLFVSTDFLPKVYSAASFEGANPTSTYFIYSNFPRIWATTFLIPFSLLELLDLAIQTSAPACFAILRSRSPAAFAVILSTYWY